MTNWEILDNLSCVATIGANHVDHACFAMHKPDKMPLVVIDNAEKDLVSLIQKETCLNSQQKQSSTLYNCKHINRWGVYQHFFRKK